jgi:cutinase
MLSPPVNNNSYQGCVVGPAVCNLLKAAYPNRVACHGIGGAYKASIGDNKLEKGTSPAAIDEGLNTFKQAAASCSNTKFVFGGYRLVESAHSFSSNSVSD